jgi:hypothetical protein
MTREEGPPGWEVPPWELPGNFRLDCEPHRGPLLRWLANAGFLCALTSFFPCVCPLVFCLVPPDTVVLFAAPVGLSVLGASLGLTVWALARHDLGRMGKGLINPEGEWETKFAKKRAGACLGVSLVSLLLWSGLALLV